MLQVFQRYVASVCFKCFRCVIRMLQVFHLDVTKVDRDVTYVASISEVCCKYLFPMFHDVTHVSHVCCECVIYMLRMFCNGFQVLSAVFASVSYVFFCML
jgi:hypothetical protein